MSARGDVTQLLGELGRGNDEAFPELLDSVYAELRRLAARHLAGERPGHTLQPTALVHEAYMRLVDQRGRNWENRAHFLSIASLAMRRILLQSARSRRAVKRGGERERVTLFEAASAMEERAEDLVALDEALDKLATFDETGARIVELRFFGGLSVEEAAAVVGVPQRTVERSWRATRAWLRRAVESND